MTATLIEVLPATFNTRIYHGDSWAQSFRITQAGQPFDLTGATVEAWCVDFNQDPAELVATVTDATGGILTISQPEGGLEPGRYAYDVEVTGLDTTTTTWVRGYIDVMRDVAHV